MDIKIPKGIKSPTVVIVSGGTMTGDEKSNRLHEKRMDLLERKLDEQYKKSIDGRSYIRDIESLQKSFIKKLDRFIMQNKQSISNQNDKLLEALKRTVSQKLKIIREKPEDTDNEEIKTFIKKIDSLEDAIRSITLKAKNNTSQGNNGRLNKSFEGFFARMEKLIQNARPRMYPSPS